MSLEPGCSRSIAVFVIFSLGIGRPKK